MIKKRHMYKYWAAAATILILSMGATLTGWSLTNEERLYQADLLFLERADMNKAHNALDAYQSVIDDDPAEAGAYWRQARALYWIGKNAPDQKRKEIYHQGAQAAEQAVKLTPDSAAAHYWLALTLALYADSSGIMKSLFLLDRIKHHLQEAIRLDPTYDDGMAYTILGRIYYSLPSIMGGDKGKAAELYQRTMDIGPQRWIAHVYLAEIHMDAGRFDEARQLLNEAIDGQCKEVEMPDCLLWKKDAREVLKRLNKKTS